MIQRLYYTELGNLSMPVILRKLSSSAGLITVCAPKVGEHNEEIYYGLLAFSSDRLCNLKQEGVI